MVKNLPAVQETCIQLLGWEDLLEKRMAYDSSVLAWRIPWTQEPGRIQSLGLQIVGHDSSYRLHSIDSFKGFKHWARPWSHVQNHKAEDRLHVGSECFFSHSYWDDCFHPWWDAGIYIFNSINCCMWICEQWVNSHVYLVISASILMVYLPQIILLWPASWAKRCFKHKPNISLGNKRVNSSKNYCVPGQFGNSLVAYSELPITHQDFCRFYQTCHLQRPVSRYQHFLSSQIGSHHSWDTLLPFRNLKAIPNVNFLWDKQSLPRSVFPFNLTHQISINFLSIQRYVFYVNSCLETRDCSSVPSSPSLVQQIWSDPQSPQALQILGTRCKGHCRVFTLPSTVTWAGKLGI